MPASAARYQRRQRAWQAHHQHLPLLRHHGWWLLHNLVAHPWLGFSPTQRAVDFHDWTSQHLNQVDELRRSEMPVIPQGRRLAWIKHNVLGHVAIGLLPICASFVFHDRGAEAMGVEDWV